MDYSALKEQLATMTPEKNCTGYQLFKYEKQEGKTSDAEQTEKILAEWAELDVEGKHQYAQREQELRTESKKVETKETRTEPSTESKTQHEEPEKQQNDQSREASSEEQQEQEKKAPEKEEKISPERKTAAKRLVETVEPVEANIAATSSVRRPSSQSKEKKSEPKEQVQEEKPVEVAPQE